MSVLVVVEHDNHGMKATTSHAVTAASQLGDVTVLVAGYRCHLVAEQVAALAPVTQVLLADAPAYEHQLVEKVAPLVIANCCNFSHLLAPATTSGKNLMPRVAAMLDVAQISDLVEIIDEETFKRPVYAGNFIATVRSNDMVKVMTVRTTAFPAASMSDSAAIVNIDEVAVSVRTRYVEQQLTRSSRPELTSARIVVSGGRGLGSAEQFQLLELLADKLGAAVGATRAAVDLGFAPNDCQIGQTGKVVAPDLYFAFGISGAIQHVAGIKDTKVIVAINKDEDAPIFKIADYGLVGDLFSAIPLLIEQLQA